MISNCSASDGIFPQQSRLRFRWGSSVQLAITWLVVTLGVAPGTGAVVLDGKFGSGGALNGPNYNITPELGSRRGNNLFHSFTRFDLSSGETATFSGPDKIQNILARVTGRDASLIDGTLRSDIAGANLFLINPNGIIFGPNAVVDVSGSFAASTANYMRLADGARFVASLDADDSGLSTAPVSAFGFLGNSHSAITIQQGRLTVQEGKTIALVGGDVAIDGGLVQAPGGQINIASVQSAGEVAADLGTPSGAEFKTEFPQQGRITLQNSAQLDTSGNGGGRIVIRGGRLLVDNSRIEANTIGTADGQGIDVAVVDDLDVLNGGQINSVSTSGLGAGGSINLSAGSIRLNGGGLVDENFFPLTRIATSTGDLFAGGGSGRGGDIVIRAGSLEVANSAQITSASFGEGNAGRIEIHALSIRLDALLTTVAQISANTQLIEGGGKAGDIVIRTGSLKMRNGATMLATSFGSGQAGRIDIDARSVALNSGSIITAGTFGTGGGGNVQVTAETLRIDGRNRLTGGPDVLTGIQAVTTSFDAPAPGGNIQITADSIFLDHMGSIFTTSYGIGSGGNIEINAGNLRLANASTIKAEGLDAGAAGNISLRAKRDVVLTGKSAVSTSALSSSGGEISVTAGSDIQLFNSRITAQAGPGGGGNITLDAPELTYLLNSVLSAEAVGDGGNLTIDPSFFVLNNSSLISRSSSANGGNITIRSDYFFKSSSVIDASAPFGLPGTVSVTAPDLDLSGSLIGLPGSLLDLESQLRPDCRVRYAGDVSTFIILGRGGLPLQPGGFVPSGQP
jgi:filamentous hemagglutinin family protein